MLFLFSSNIQKKVLLGLMGAFTVLGFAPHSYAQPSEFLLESNFGKSPFGEGKRFTGKIAGTRDERCPFTTLMPTSRYSSTSKSNPTFWVYVRPNERPLAVQATLSIMPLETDEEALSLENFEELAISPLEDLIQEAPELILTVQDAVPDNGLISLEVPISSDELILNQPYKWTVTVACGESYEAIAAKSETSAKEYGIVSRTSQNDKSWIDTIDALARLEKSSTDTTAIDSDSANSLKEWSSYLQTIDDQLSGNSALNP